MIDHPLVRASQVCPLCGCAKDPGLVACWTCYRIFNMRNGSPYAEQAIEFAEIMLSGASP